MKNDKFNFVGFGCGLTLIFSILKIIGWATMEWIWVFMPMIITYVPVVIFIIGGCVVAVKGGKPKKTVEKRTNDDVFKL